MTTGTSQQDIPRGGSPSSTSHRIAASARRNPVPYAGGISIAAIAGGLLAVLRWVAEAAEPMGKISTSLKGLSVIGATVAMALILVAAAFAWWAGRVAAQRREDEAERDELRRKAQDARDDKQDERYRQMMEQFGFGLQRLQAQVGELRKDMGEVKASVTRLEEQTGRVRRMESVR